jgi:hypothetical protein
MHTWSAMSEEETPIKTGCSWHDISFVLSFYLCIGRSAFYLGIKSRSNCAPFDMCALAAWRSGHLILLCNRRLGFESRQGIRFLGKIYIAMLLCTVHMYIDLCNVNCFVLCWKREIKALATNILRTRAGIFSVVEQSLKVKKILKIKKWKKCRIVLVL